MRWTDIKRRAVSLLAYVAVGASVAGCSTLYTLYAPPGAVVNPPSRFVYENPDDFRVDAARYPQYRAKRAFHPPSFWLGDRPSREKMVNIELSDVWHVTHEYHGYLLVFSPSFQERQIKRRREAKEVGHGPDLFHLMVQPDGRVVGWVPLTKSQTSIGIAGPLDGDGPQRAQGSRLARRAAVRNH